MKIRLRNIWGYYFYDTLIEFYEDLGLTCPSVSGVSDARIRKLMDLNNPNLFSEKDESAFKKYFGLKEESELEDIYGAFFKKHCFELRTIHDTVRGKKRKLTKKEIAKYAAWACLSGTPSEKTVRDDIMRRWRMSWFVKTIPMLKKEGYEINPSFLMNYDFFAVRDKDKTGDFEIYAKWTENNMTIVLSYKKVWVFITREYDDNGHHYSDNGEMLFDKWEIRGAPSGLESYLLTKKGYKLNENRFLGEYPFIYVAKTPDDALQAINSLKDVQNTIARYFKRFTNAHDLFRNAQKTVKTNPDKALEFALKATELNPNSVEAHGIIAYIYLSKNQIKSAKKHLRSIKKARLERHTSFTDEARLYYGCYDEIICYPLALYFARYALLLIEDNWSYIKNDYRIKETKSYMKRIVRVAEKKVYGKNGKDRDIRKPKTLDFCTKRFLPD